jgi:ferredoxin
MRAIVDQDLCIGCGLCADLCPEVFELDDDDKAQAIADEVPEEAEEACRDAVEQCPVEAIKIEE